MSKRKREDGMDNDDSKIEDQALRIKVSRLKAKLDQSIKSLHAALKLARGFERQKLGRRQKAANEAPQTLLRLREEVIVLKQLQLEQKSRNYLVKQLARTKRIKEHPAFLKVYGSNPVLESTQSGAEANVIGRLFNSAPVKQVVPEIMKNIFSVLGLSPLGHGAAVSSKEVKTRRDTSNNDEESHADSGDQPIAASTTSFIEQSAVSASEDEGLFDDYARGRLASGSEDSDDEVFSDPEPSIQSARRREHLKSRFPDERELSISRSPSESLDREEEYPPAQKSTKTIAKTAFLPSLSLGGYYSGSESDGADASNDRETALPVVRKNRRGQRARQQIAELKFGKNAKHLAKRNEQNGSDVGWDPKKGAVGRGDRSKDGLRRKGVNRNPADTSAAIPNRTPRPRAKVRDDQGPLHPSWEAAKKRKLQDQSQVTFAGKRTTFD